MPDSMAQAGPATSRRLILVTGAPRSGTTAVGRNLALPRGARTLHEPLNHHVGLREVERYFEVPGACGRTEDWVDDLVARIRALELRYKRGVFPGETGLRRMLKLLVGGRALNSYRLCRLTPSLRTVVWKDPFAVFLADRLAGHHGVDVVVTVRNPWAVAGSFRRLGWSFDVGSLAERLRDAGLADRLDLDVPAADADDDDTIARAAILWRMVYGALEAWGRESPRIRFVSLEGLVRNPVATYRDLYRHLGMEWTDRVERRIERSYRSARGPRVPDSDRPHDSRRDLTAVNRYWRELLSEEEARRIRTLAGDAWTRVSRRSGDASIPGAAGTAPGAPVERHGASE